jgi:uncharacterized SAM-binding protein YcdF (DUF218 family)
VAAIVKATLVPGSLPFLLLGLVAGATLLYLGSRSATWGRRWLTAIAVLYLVLSLGPVASVLIAGLQGGYRSIVDVASARGATVVVVIGSGAVTYAAGEQALHQLGRGSALAVLEAERLHRLLDPKWIVTSGGIPDLESQTRPESAVMRDALVGLGVPHERILLESGSTNTAEQVAAVRHLLTSRGIAGPVVIVVTADHARRVMATASRSGLDVVASVASDPRRESQKSGWRRWRPSLEALRLSESAMYEYLALIHYWWKLPTSTAPA